jgi:hypothetical protein
MPRGVAPNATGAWRQALSGRRPGELLELQSEVEVLLEQPAFTAIRTLLIKAHDELVADMVSGPARAAEDYAKQAGAILGLESVELLLREIRSAAERGEAQLAAEAERTRPQMEAA